MKQFCGSEFWNVNVTWNTGKDQIPDFTPCFHMTVVSWVPSLVLILASVVELPKYFKSEFKNIPWNWLNLTKTGLTCLLLILTVVELGFTIGTDLDDNTLTEIFLVDYVNSAVLLLTYAW